MTSMEDRQEQAAKAMALRELHASPALLELVNVWDVASAEHVAGWPETTALATASAAIAASHGYPDGEVIPLGLHLAAIGRICRATPLPVTADLERGYGDVAETVRGALACGVAGLNIEDDLCPPGDMVDRVAIVVEQGRSAGIPLVLNARTDVYLLRGDATEDALLEESVDRGLAFLAAGADCVFVPGCVDPASIRRLVAAFGPGRLSLLAVPGLPDTRELGRLGVARLSHGPFPFRGALAALDAWRPRGGAAE